VFKLVTFRIVNLEWAQMMHPSDFYLLDLKCSVFRNLEMRVDARVPC
jgi:hypothetical protein